jgi:hypothetical protein
MTLLVLVLAVLTAVVWREVQRLRHEAAVHAALQTFGPAQAAALDNPRELLIWYPLAQAARKLQPRAFATLDAATGGAFPFTRDQVERAHAKVSSEWLAWEKAHDEEYRLKAASVEHELRNASGEAASLAKARLERVQHEKIERYQQRYEEYIRTAKALQGLLQ